MAYREVIEDIGQSSLDFLKAIKYILSGKMNMDQIVFQISKTGVDSTPIVGITAIFIGLALSTQLAIELQQRFGAENLVGGIVGMATVRELAPVISSIVIAGRAGAAISAEIGTMRISEQIDALSVLGIDPIKYLLVPRLIALGVSTPLLTVIAAILSILASMFITQKLVNVDYKLFLDSVRSFINLSDVAVMMLKAFVFGSIVSVVATISGLQAKGGAEAVGYAATKTVVWSIILIFTFNYIITSLFFGL